MPRMKRLFPVSAIPANWSGEHGVVLTFDDDKLMGRNCFIPKSMVPDLLEIVAMAYAELQSHGPDAIEQAFLDEFKSEGANDEQHGP